MSPDPNIGLTQAYEASALGVRDHPAVREHLRHLRAELDRAGAGWWGKLHRRGLSPAIETPDLSLEMRMWLLATTKARAGGHAVLRDGELSASLPKVSPQTGEVSEFSRRHLREAMSRLISTGLLAPTSEYPGKGPACLVLPEAVYEIRARYRPAPCEVHGHSYSWGSGQWFDPTSAEEELAAVRKAARSHSGVVR